MFTNVHEKARYFGAMIQIVLKRISRTSPDAPAGDGTLLCPLECLVHISGFKYPETAYVLRGLGVRPVGDEHRTIRLRSQRLCLAGRGKAAGELPGAGSINSRLSAHRRFAFLSKMRRLFERR
jgi:hypothetical protein